MSQKPQYNNVYEEIAALVGGPSMDNMITNNLVKQGKLPASQLEIYPQRGGLRGPSLARGFARGAKGAAKKGMAFVSPWQGNGRPYAKLGMERGGGGMHMFAPQLPQDPREWAGLPDSQIPFLQENPRSFTMGSNRTGAGFGFGNNNFGAGFSLGGYGLRGGFDTSQPSMGLEITRPDQPSTYLYKGF